MQSKICQFECIINVIIYPTTDKESICPDQQAYDYLTIPELITCTLPTSFKKSNSNYFGKALTQHITVVSSFCL